mmetsp:Transcript_34012/g.87198  ORF Transcript_34012/g.87198 Transcript_34012/m.87198 type:complete len:467 (-) Transcript_34012:141-1541(-)
MAAATAELSQALVQSFLTVGTPTAFVMHPSPREPAETTPRRKDSWGTATAILAAEDAAARGGTKVSIVALTSSAPPTTLNVGKRSWSTLSFGDGQDPAATDAYLDHVPAALGRYTSEDFTALLNREVSDAAPQWTLGGIAEGSSSPTNVDFAAPATTGLVREKSTDFATVPASALLRAQSDDFSLLLFRQRSNSMLQNQVLGGAADASTAGEHHHQGAPASQAPQVATALSPPREEDEEAASSESEESEVGEEEPVRRTSARNAGKPKRKLVELEDSDDDYMPPSSSKKGSKKARKAGGGGGKAAGGYAHNNRGAHVKGRPEMQETARNGQRHWATEVQELRNKWNDARCWEANPAFQSQLELMARRHIKNQHECLLRALHIATARGMIDPLPFNTAEGRSFLGWTGFAVRPNRAAEFRTAVEEMFPQPLLENTLHNTFRRAGLVPGSWSDAWLGFAPFGYKKPVA